MPPKRMRNRITVEEARQVSDKIMIEEIRMNWGDGEVGDQFIINGRDEVYTCIGSNYDDKSNHCLYFLSKDGIKLSVRHKECFPLLTIQQMINILTLCGGDIQIQRHNTKWFVFSRDSLYVSEEEGELCSVLWEAVKIFRL